MIAEPSPRIEAYVEALVERYPDDVAGSPWASPPVIDEASGPIVYLLMSYSRAEEVSEYAAALAREQALTSNNTPMLYRPAANRPASSPKKSAPNRQPCHHPNPLTATI
ncbi:MULTISPECIES: hypothetical protein [unclassified Streptomyces]|uniref:hypothetical protein n=1 Tax=unclassified Streptomyces TaxID=2593676 RepID=UPI002B1E318E|nr:MULTISPECIES: hypothetical protein [unclassified Streptomyces]